MLVLVVLILIVVLVILSRRDNESFHQISHLPFSSPPVGRGSLGWAQKEILKDLFPKRSFPTGKVPISCPPNGVRIYETGNALNPNVYSSFGVLKPDQLTF